MQEPTIKPPPQPSGEFLNGRRDIREVIRGARTAEYRVWGTKKRSEHEKELARKGRYIVFPAIEEPTELVPPIDWHQDPFQSESWRAQLHTQRFLDVLFQMYRKDEDVAALERARDIALDWIAQNTSHRRDLSKFAWFDKVVGDRAPYFAYLLTAGCQEGSLEAEQANTLLRSLIEHAEYLADDRNYTHQTNHGLFQDAGLLVLARYLDFLQEASDWREHALARVLETLSRHVDVDEGVHLEHSPEYQYLTTNLVGKIQRLGDVDDPWLAELLERMQNAGRWFVLPDGRIPPIGDSDWKPAPKWAQEAAETPRGLALFRSSGWTVVRAANASLIVSAGYHSTVHKHLDDLSFYLYSRGEPVVVDPGKYGYDADDGGRGYAVSARAHNGLLVDGGDVSLTAIEPYGSAIEWAAERDGWYAISAVNKIASSQGVRHRRLFLFRPGSALVLVDSVESRRTRTYTRLFHLGPGVDVSGEPDSLELRGSALRGSLEESSEHSVSARLVRGQSEPVIQGWVFPGYREWRQVWTVDYESRLKSGIFVTALSLRKRRVDASARRLERGGVEVMVNDPRSFDFTAEFTPDGLNLERR